MIETLKAENHQLRENIKKYKKFMTNVDIKIKKMIELTDKLTNYPTINHGKIISINKGDN